MTRRPHQAVPDLVTVTNCGTFGQRVCAVMEVWPDRIVCQVDANGHTYPIEVTPRGWAEIEKSATWVQEPYAD